MSGQTVALALEKCFHEICQAELVRLRGRTAALSAADRMAVETITVEVIQAIAAQPARALRQSGDGLAETVMRLFRVPIRAMSPPDQDA